MDESSNLVIDRTILPEGYTYREERVAPEKYSFSIKEVIDKESADDWMKVLQERSKTAWRVSQSYPHHSGLYMYRKDFRCQHNTYPRPRNGRHRLHKHTGCRAMFKIKVKRILALKDTEFPCMCVMKNRHNHLIDSAHMLRFRDMADSTRAQILCYFYQGLSPVRARKSLEFKLKSLHESDYENVLCDTHYLPTQSVIHHLYKKEHSRMVEGRQSPESLGDLVNYVVGYDASDLGKSKVQQEDSRFVVAVCTPIMQRAIELLPEASKVVFIEILTSPSDTKRLYVLSAGCDYGNVPLGCVLTDSEGENALVEGFQLLKSCFPGDSVLAKGGPLIVVTQNDLCSRRDITEVWYSSVFMESHFQVLKKLWNWILNSNLNLPKAERARIYICIRELLGTETEYELNTKMEEIANQNVFLKNSSLATYLKVLWSERHSWAKCYFDDIPSNFNYLGRYFDNFSIMKESLESRMETDSLVQLFHFIINDHEKHLENRLLDFGLERCKNAYTRTILENKSVVPHIVERNENGCYVIKNTLNSTVLFDGDNGFCFCNKAKAMQRCNHFSLVTIQLQADRESSIETFRTTAYRLATGALDVQLETISPVVMQINYSNEEPASDDMCEDPAPVDMCEDPAPVDMCEDPAPYVSDGNAPDPPLQENTCPIEKEKIRTQTFFQYILAALESNPSEFLPAVKTMNDNFEKLYCNTPEFIECLYSFGKKVDPFCGNDFFVVVNEISSEPTE